jgi:hypothetical protein
MDKQPKTLQLADWCDLGVDPYDKAAAIELRRLHKVNQELVEALQLAIDSHGYLLMSDPPQDAWKYYKVESKAKAALTKAKENT